MFTHLDFYKLNHFRSHSCRVYILKKPSKCVLNKSKNPKMEIELVNFKPLDHSRATAVNVKLSYKSFRTILNLYL